MPDGGYALSGLHTFADIRFGRYRRSQIEHGLRAVTGAYTQYVRMTSTAQVQYGK